MNKIRIFVLPLFLIISMSCNIFAGEAEILYFEEPLDLSRENTNNCGRPSCMAIMKGPDFEKIKNLDIDSVLKISLLRMASFFYKANGWNDIIIREINISSDFNNNKVGVKIIGDGAISKKESLVLRKDVEAILDKIYEFTGKLQRLISRKYPMFENIDYLFGFKNIKIERDKISFKVILIIKDEEENKDIEM